ncbi:MAG TPA: hypothetical protein VFN94_10940, partial [Nitrospiria bacterium]|nr:hypothetical protein [Nitrospiria bacterium]
RVISHTVEMLDAYPESLGQHIDDRFRENEEERALALSTKGELDALMEDADLGPLFKDRPRRMEMLMNGWIQNPSMSIREVAEALKTEIFSELVAEGVPPAEAKEAAEAAAEGVADKIAGGLDPQDHGKQEAKNRESVMKHGGKVGRGLLTRLAGGPGARDAEHGGMPKTKTSRAGTSSDFRRPGDKDWNKA